MSQQHNFLLIILFVFNIFQATNGQFLYSNYHVYEVNISEAEKSRILQNLESEDRSIIFWDLHTSANSVVIVSPQRDDELRLILEDNKILYELRDNNVQKTLEKAQDLSRISQWEQNYDWTQYHSLEETYEWLKSLSRNYPQKVKLLYAGSSFEERDILGVRLSLQKGNKGILLEGGMHAREWISPATATYLLNQLLFSNETEIKSLAENYDWYIFPHLNPDGYVYSQTTDRLWRKTRSTNDNKRCFGADPNRNWDFHWNEQGSSDNPCSESFAGTKPFSEIEVKSFAAFLESLRGKIQVYISFHSYSQLLLFPYGYTKAKAPNHMDLLDIGLAATSALLKRYGTKYQVGNIYDTIYPASGSSIEWAYGVQNINLSYCYELRPSGNRWNGFLLPSNQIIPNGEEIMDSLIDFFRASKQLSYL